MVWSLHSKYTKPISNGRQSIGTVCFLWTGFPDSHIGLRGHPNHNQCLPDVNHQYESSVFRIFLYGIVDFCTFGDGMENSGSCHFELVYRVLVSTKSFVYFVVLSRSCIAGIWYRYCQTVFGRWRTACWEDGRSTIWNPNKPCQTDFRCRYVLAVDKGLFFCLFCVFILFYDTYVELLSWCVIYINADVIESLIYHYQFIESSY